MYNAQIALSLLNANDESFDAIPHMNTSIIEVKLKSLLFQNSLTTFANDKMVRKREENQCFKLKCKLLKIKD